MENYVDKGIIHLLIQSTDLLHKTAIDFLNILAQRTANIWKIPKVGVFNGLITICIVCLVVMGIVLTNGMK
jgi:hypothetical protein